MSFRPSDDRRCARQQRVTTPGIMRAMPDWVDVDPDVLGRVAERCLALPDAWDEPAWTGHRFLVRRRNFAHVFAMCDEDGDVSTIMAFRSPDDEREVLLAAGHPYFPLGWGRNVVGLVLDDDTDWDEVGELVTESYCVLAPKKLVALVDRPAPTG
jgi:predicted DNA-binding protein (MmcQ/YjbR family)